MKIPKLNLLSWAIALVTSAFWAATTLIEYGWFSWIINVIRIIISFAVVYVYFKAAFRALTHKSPADTEHLLVGVFLAWLSALGFSLWNDFTRVGVFASPLTGFLALIMIMAGLFHLTAPSYTNWRRTVVGVLIGLGVASLPSIIRFLT